MIPLRKRYCKILARSCKVIAFKNNCFESKIFKEMICCGKKIKTASHAKTSYDLCVGSVVVTIKYLNKPTKKRKRKNISTYEMNMIVYRIYVNTKYPIVQAN